MTDPSRFRPRDARDEFDADSLSWLAGELRSSSARFRSAIDEAVRREGAERMASLREARAEVRQIHSALRIVDVPGFSVIVATLDELLERVETRRLSLSAAMAQAGEQAMAALLACLNAPAGRPARPLQLFPAYRVLLEAMGAERIHPSDLFFPRETPLPVVDGAAPPKALMPDELMRLRRRFEEALLKTLKNPSPAAAREHVGAMRQIIAAIGETRGEPSDRAFWQIMEAFAEAAEAGHLSLDARQLFAQINLRLRRMSQGQALGDEDRLKREALFIIALSQAGSPAIGRIRRAYGLDGLIPPDFPGWPAAAPEADALPQARHRLAQAKVLWERHVGGEAGTGAAFGDAVRALRGAAEAMGLPALDRLLAAMAGVARQSGPVRPWDALGLEMETGLLFIENAFENARRLPDDFAARAAAMASRLSAPDAAASAATAASGAVLPDIGEPPAADAVQDAGALIGELDAGLRHVERMLEEYFRDPAQHVALNRLDLVLGQVEGNLALLAQPEAVRALRHARATVRRFMAGIEGGPDPVERQRLERNLDTLDGLVASLRRDTAGARERYRFDEVRGLLQQAPPGLAAIAAGEGDDASAPKAADDGADADVPVLRETLDEAPGPVAPETETPPGLAESGPPPDALLMPLFLDEARDRLTDVGHAIQSWREQPANAAWGQALLRQIHTLQGSARIAGAAALGKHLHDMEGQVAECMQRPLSAADVDALADFHDRSLTLFDDLRQAGQRSAAALVRVRADLLDRLSRQAAKAGLLNAKLDAGLDSLRQGVAALAQAMASLRLDLREVDAVVAAQMSARLGIAGNREFDPAEFDRLSRLQELARMLAQGVDQAGALRQAMTQALDNSAVDLAMQARLATDMQHNLARVRRARLGGIADRLQRAVRQTAKEAGKSVRLEIRGAAVELDRDLLDSLPAPLEHLLRNAIVHGIEAAGDRRAAGKEETGELVLEAWQEGRETVIRVTDDGRGLNLHRIRRKGMQLGLLTEDAALSDDDTQALIFSPGFSTADAITPLAGRGMGLDAARAEIEKLGGRIAVHSVTGKGVQFILRLPAGADGTAAATSSAPPSAPASAPDARPVVMVVDDSHSVRRAAQRLLTRAGYHPLPVKDGMEALESLRTLVPAVMLIDAEMPHLDGFGLVRAMRADARLQNVPVIMISSRTTVRHRDSAAALGVRAYLGKPYREEELLSLIGELTAAG